MIPSLDIEPNKFADLNPEQLFMRLILYIFCSSSMSFASKNFIDSILYYKGTNCLIKNFFC